jgi:hypothetical protein
MLNPKLIRRGFNSWFNEARPWAFGEAPSCLPEAHRPPQAGLGPKEKGRPEAALGTLYLGIMSDQVCPAMGQHDVCDLDDDV